MARPILHYLSAALLGTLAFSIGGGCADSESMLVIRGVLTLAPPECVASADADTMRLGGSIDKRLRTSYEAPLQVSNQLMARGDSEALRAETSRVTITGAEVSLRSPNNSELDSYTVVASGSIDPGTDSEPGRGVVYATLIPDIQKYDESINPLVVRVQVYGTTVGGQDVWSNWFTYPVFRRGLIYFPASALDPDTQACTANSTEVAPCLVGQDDLVPCSACLGQTDCA